MQIQLVNSWTVSNSDQDVEANLLTVFQSVRGSKQYWYLCHSEVLCMVREFGPPTLFLTLSCAEYESLERSKYLRKVNDVPSSFPIGKLCTEDPISVSRKFSPKFHDFFERVIIKGGVLGRVAHHFYKNEYQARGAPHYHPPLDRRCTQSEEVLRWIQNRIMCHIPDETVIQSFISWSQSTSTTSVVGIAKEGKRSRALT